MAKSADAFRTIAEVAEWLDTPAHVLRFWESKFNQIRPVKRAGGRRYYRPEDMALLGGIKTLLHEEGMSVKGAQKMLRERGVKYVSGLSPPIDGAPPIRDVSPREAPPAAQAPPAPVVAAPGPREIPAFRPFGGAGRPPPPGPVVTGRTEPLAPSAKPGTAAPGPLLGRPTPEGTDGGLPSFLTGKSGIGAAQHRPDPPIFATPLAGGSDARAPDPATAGGAPSAEAGEPAPDEGSDVPAIDTSTAPAQTARNAPDPALPPIPAPPEAADLMPHRSGPQPAAAAVSPPPNARADVPEIPAARVAMVRQGPGFLALLDARDRLARDPARLAPALERLSALARRLAEDPSRTSR